MRRPQTLSVDEAFGIFATQSPHVPLSRTPTQWSQVRVENFSSFFADSVVEPGVLSYPLRTLVRMKVVDPTELISGFRRVDLATATPIQFRRALDDIRRARLDGAEAEIAQRLKTTSPTPERDIANSAQRSNRHGTKVLARAAALTDTPSFSSALEAGSLSGDHVDVFTKVLATLDRDVKTGFADAAPVLIEKAATSGSTPEEFAATLHTTAERIAADGGMSRFERQRRATRLRTWTDRASGIWRLSGTFDPDSGARIQGRLEAAMAAMFATIQLVHHADRSGREQDHLRALALLALTTGPALKNTTSCETDAETTRNDNADRSGQTDRTDNASDSDRTDQSDGRGHTAGTDEWDLFTESLGTATKRFGRPEFTVVIDTTNLDPDGHPTVDWGIPITIPWSRIRHLSTNADIRPVIVRDGAVIDADGELNLGRTTRLANRAQRRALHAVYATCAVPGCNVSFNHTKPHHLHWWRHGSPTDLANLLPLCSQHHHAAHEGGWILTLGPNRELTIELPGG